MNVLKFALIGWPMRILIALFAIAIAPILYIVALISIVGIPLAIILLFVPALGMLYIAHELLYQFAVKHALPGTHGRAVSALTPIVAMLIVATLANARIDSETARLVAGDRDALSGGAVRSIALVEGQDGRRDEKLECAGLCQRLLLTGAVGEVLVARVDENADAIDPAAPARAYRWRRGGACETNAISENNDGVQRQERDALRPDEAVRLRIAAGECLDGRAARLGDAHAALLSTRPARGNTAYSARLKPFADAVEAARLAYFSRQNGVFVEEHRRTMIVARRHLPIALPAIVHGYGLQTAIAFFRLDKRINRQKYETADDARVRFLTERLGLRIGLAEGDAPDRAATVDAIIKSSAPDATSTSRDLIDDFLRATPRAKDARSRAYAERVVVILEDPKIELPFSIATGTAHVSRHHPDLAGRAAAALLARIKAAEPGARQSRYNDSLIRIAANALRLLPDETIKDNAAAIIALIGDRQRRGDAAQLFARLSVLNAEGVAPLLRVIDAAREDSAVATDRHDDRWRDLYSAGLSGLCKAGAPEAAAPLAARIRAKEEFRQFHWAQGVKTLIVLGASPTEVRALYSHRTDEDWLKRVDEEIARVQKRPRCD